MSQKQPNHICCNNTPTYSVIIYNSVFVSNGKPLTSYVKAVYVATGMILFREKTVPELIQSQ